MGQPNPNPVLESIQSNTEVTSKNAINLADILSKQGDVMREASIDATTAASAAGDVYKTTQLGLMLAQDSAKKAQQLIGSDALDPDSLIPDLARRFREGLQKSQQQRDYIDARNQVGFFDNPLAYIAWQFDKGSAIEHYNKLADDTNSSLATIEAVSNATTEAANATKAAAKTITQDSIAKGATVASLTFKLQAAESNYKALGADADAIKAIQTGNREILANRVESWKIQAQDFSMGQESARLGMQRQQLDVFLAEHKDKQEAKSTLRSVITAGMGVAGLNPPDDKKLTQLEVLYSTPEGRKELQPILDAGIKKLTTGENILAGDPGRAFYVATKINPNTKDNPELGKRLDYVKALASTLGKGGVNINKPEEVIAGINAKVKNDVKLWDSNAEIGGSFYAAPSLLELSGAASVSGTKLYQTILAPQVKAGVQTITPSALLAQSAAAIQKGDLDINDVVKGITQYYGTAVLQNSLNNITVGIPAQKSYKAKIADTGFFSDDSVDLVKPEQVTQAVLKLMNKQTSLRNFLPELDHSGPGFSKIPPVGVK